MIHAREYWHTRRFGDRHAAVAACALGLLAMYATPARALGIVPTFETSITGNANAAVIQRAIYGALGFYAAFADPGAVSIDFQLAPAGASYLGASQSAFFISSYADYTNSLATDAAAYPNNAAEATGYSHLATGNSAAQIRATSADFRALGFAAAGYLNASGTSGGSFDGVVYLNATLLSGFGGGGAYPARQTIQHEVNEVLGIGGSGTVLNIMQQNSLSAPPTFNGQTDIGPLDLFRYAGGTRSLATSGSVSAYFSIDGGTTNLAAFNQNAGGDYGDWGATLCTPLVQQAFSCASPAAAMSLTSPEVTALQAVGYDLPEPASLAVLASGIAGLAWRRRA